MITPDPERWQRIEAALDAALDHPPERRAAILDEFCAGDPELRAEVERLLRSSDDAGDIFDAPPAAVLSAATSEALSEPADRDRLEPGDRVGAWRIIDLLGRGGMGAVYRAERADGAFDREVALKVVKRGMDTDDILRRFRRERQILARLEHPNIAALLDGGATDTGVPFFVMELARGDPIDVWCDRHHLNIEQRLRLFLPVCDAVRHAHSSLIVHRDLKPGNILIVDGQPKLLDFGIAKVLHAEGEPDETATRVHERRLTPRYAAPEQLRDEPTTTATDVYSLGVILYELLTGRAPYELHGGLAEIERIVCTREPRAPSSVASRESGRRGGPETVQLARLRGSMPAALSTRLHGDLDAIVMKALEKEPARRYSSVEAFAADIRNHLEGRPVVARPASRWYRFRKFVGRNRTTAGLAAAAALALLLGSGLALWQAGRARSESLRAQQEAARAAAARDYLIDLFGNLNPDVLGGRRTFTLDEIIDLSVTNLASLAGEPILQAGVMNAVGSVIANLGEYGKADSLFSEAARVLQSAGRLPELSESLMGRGEIRRRQLAFDSAIVAFERALEIRRDALPEDDPRIPESMVALAAAYYSGDRDEAAESLFVSVLELESANARVRAAAFEGLGDLRFSRGRSTTDSAAAAPAYAEAIQMYTQAFAIHTDLHEEAAAARLRFGRSFAYSQLGDHATALNDSEQALTTLRRLYGDEHPDVFNAHFYRALALESAGDPAGAAHHFARAAGISERLNGPDHLYTASPKARRAALLLQLDSLSAARAEFTDAARGYRHLIANDPADTANIANLASLEQLFGERAASDGDLATAQRDLRAAWSHWSEIGDSTRAAAAAAALARVFERAGSPDSAAFWLARGPAGVAQR